MQAATLAPARPGALVVRARPSAPRASLRRGATLVRASADREAAPQAEQLAATALLAAAGLLAPMVLDTEAAQAVPELLKGRTFSLIHPGERQAGAGGMPWRAAPRPAGATAAPPPRQAAARELAYHLSSPNLLPPFCSHHGLPVWRLPVGRLPGPPVAPRAVRGGAKGLLGSGCSDTALPPAALCFAWQRGSRFCWGWRRVLLPHLFLFLAPPSAPWGACAGCPRAVRRWYPLHTPAAQLSQSPCIAPLHPLPPSIPFPRNSELAGVIKEKKALLPPADAEGNRIKTPLDGEIAALEAVRWLGWC